jgi:hypothetical protein
MINQELLECIWLFREKAEKGRLVVFIGAGVSRNVDGMPDWNMLIQKMAEAIGYSRCVSCKKKREGCEKCCLLKNDYSTDEFLKIPQYVYNKDQEQYKQILKENISAERIDAPLSSVIFDINPAHIITTNYDHLIEASSNILCEQYQIVVNDKDLLNAEKGKYIIKMHGDISEVDSIVLKEQDYLDYSQRHVLIELFVKSLLTDHIVLFLGYSLNDYNIKLILGWLNYMRSQNSELEKGRKVGYIVLDQDEINAMERGYFESNNIGVINISSFPLVREVPASLSHEKGKRLYSFLSLISNPALEKDFTSFEASVKLMAQQAFVSYEILLKMLYIRQYDVLDWHLRLFSKEDFLKLKDFFNQDSEGSALLKQLFINAGLFTIEYVELGFHEELGAGKPGNNNLIRDRFFELYISNDYHGIQQLLEDCGDSIEPNKKNFYWSIIDGYEKCSEKPADIEVLNMTWQRVAYLHNSAAIEAFTVPTRFDSKKVEQFVANIPSAKERDFFSGYLDIYSGNTKKRLEMQAALDQLIKDVGNPYKINLGGTPYNKLFVIKRIAMTQYFFYFNNCILYQGFSDLKVFFRPYIEAIICSNCDAAESSRYLGFMEFKSEKYCLEYIDLDIITKFISTKDLNSFIKTYNVHRLNVEKEKTSFLTNCLYNLSVFVTESRLYGFMQSSLITLSNLILLLNLVDLDADHKKTIKSAIGILLNDDTLVHYLFSVAWPDFKLTLNALKNLCQLLDLTDYSDTVQSIISGQGFFEYAANAPFNSLRQFLGMLLPNGGVNSIPNSILHIINEETDTQKKIILLRLFYRQISSEQEKEEYKRFLLENFSHLSTQALYDFVLSGWISLTSKEIKDFLDGILAEAHHASGGVYMMPDSVETQLECAYILFISGIINDISALAELAEGRSHLQFLLNPDEFDYSQVDFSNYMWENFARHERFMKYFIAHKDAIVPQIVERIHLNSASEAEKRILYGFLLDGNDAWMV